MTVDLGLYLVYVLFGVAFLSAILLPLINSLKDPAVLLRSLYGVGAIVVLFLVAFGVSNGVVTPEQQAKGIDEGLSKLIGSGLILFYMVFGLAVLGLVFSEINKALK